MMTVDGALGLGILLPRIHSIEIHRQRRLTREDIGVKGVDSDIASIMGVT